LPISKSPKIDKETNCKFDKKSAFDWKKREENRDLKKKATFELHVFSEDDDDDEFKRLEKRKIIRYLARGWKLEGHEMKKFLSLVLGIIKMTEKHSMIKNHNKFFKPF
jgi:hypothetical protein